MFGCIYRAANSCYQGISWAYQSANRMIDQYVGTRHRYNTLRRVNKWLSTLSALLEPGFGLGVAQALAWGTVFGLIPSMAELTERAEEVDPFVKNLVSLVAGGAGVAFAVHVYYVSRAIRQGQVEEGMELVPTVQEQRSGGLERMVKMVYARDLIRWYKEDQDWFKYLHWIIESESWAEYVADFCRPYSSGTLVNYLVFMNPCLLSSLANLHFFTFLGFGVFGESLLLVRKLMVRSILEQKRQRGERAEERPHLPNYNGMPWRSVRKIRVIISALTAGLDACIENAFMMMIFLDYAGIRTSDNPSLYFGLMAAVSIPLALASAIGGAKNEILRQVGLDVLKRQYEAEYRQNQRLFDRLDLMEPLPLDNRRIPYMKPVTAQHKMNLAGAAALSMFTTMVINNLCNLITMGFPALATSFPEQYRLICIIPVSVIYKMWLRNRLDTHEYIGERIKEALAVVVAEHNNLERSRQNAVNDARARSRLLNPSNRSGAFPNRRLITAELQNAHCNSARQPVVLVFANAEDRASDAPEPLLLHAQAGPM